MENGYLTVAIITKLCIKLKSGKVNAAQRKEVEKFLRIEGIEPCKVTIGESKPRMAYIPTLKLKSFIENYSERKTAFQNKLCTSKNVKSVSDIQWIDVEKYQPDVTSIAPPLKLVEKVQKASYVPEEDRIIPGIKSKWVLNYLDPNKFVNDLPTVLVVGDATNGQKEELKRLIDSGKFTVVEMGMRDFENNYTVALKYSTIIFLKRFGGYEEIAFVRENFIQSKTVYNIEGLQDYVTTLIHRDDMYREIITNAVIKSNQTTDFADKLQAVMK